MHGIWPTGGKLTEHQSRSLHDAGSICPQGSHPSNRLAASVINSNYEHRHINTQWLLMKTCAQSSRSDEST